MKSESVKSVLKKHTDKLLSIPGVVGTAVGLYNNKPCIKVFVVKKTSLLEKKIPDIIDNFVVRVEETGKYRAYQNKKTDIDS